MKVETGTNNLTKQTSSNNSLSLKAKATLKTIKLGIQALCSATLCKHITLPLLANRDSSLLMIPEALMKDLGRKKSTHCISRTRESIMQRGQVCRSFSSLYSKAKK